MKALRLELTCSIAALQLLTRLPVPSPAGFSPRILEGGVKYFPLVGAIVGALCAAALFASSLVWGGMLPSILAVALGVVLTGAIHEDGFADFFDGLGGRTRETRLAIMKDSHIGAFGVLALILALAIKVYALAALPVAMGAAALVAAHAGARFAVFAAMSLLPYAGKVSAAKIKPFASACKPRSVAIAAILGFGPLLLLPLSAAAMALPAGIVAATLLASSARRMLGGYTGDVLGAVEQAFEIAFLLGAAAAA
ncbi:MAG TPA: adenosylcobinamide-GDP ribazoletransferase [Hyphomicrobiales bacterium]|nr:adenosylcobinamide-GDP ribazoletransferase [Hyphomicrobiales bacterium]